MKEESLGMWHVDFMSLMKSLSNFLMSGTKKEGGIKIIFDAPGEWWYWGSLSFVVVMRVIIVRLYFGFLFLLYWFPSVWPILGTGLATFLSVCMVCIIVRRWGVVVVVIVVVVSWCYGLVGMWKMPRLSFDFWGHHISAHLLMPSSIWGEDWKHCLIGSFFHLLCYCNLFL